MRHFDLIVIGSGSGNTIVDERFADWSVAMIDDAPEFGGTCLNRGCIPTKMFVCPADLGRIHEKADRVDVALPPGRPDWPAIRDRIFGRIDPIAAGGESWRRDADNITLYRETAVFTGPKTLRVGDEDIAGERIVIAAGSRSRWPDVPGLDDPAVADRLHTSDTIMRLDALPASLVILGGGVIAAEFAHVFSAFGTRVTVVARSSALLRGEDAEISRRYTELAARDVTLRLGQRVVGLQPGARGNVGVVTADADGVEYVFEGERVLVALGRVPNGDRLDVAAAGIETDAAGRIVVDAQQRTNVEGVWALGDVSSPYQLKHVANRQARIVQHNLLHPDDPITDDRRFPPPHGIFAHPQVAAVGLTEQAAREAGHDVTCYVQSYADVAYGWAMEDEGVHCVKVVADRATGRLLGAHILGPEATLLIQPLVQAMTFDQDIRDVAADQYWIHPALTEVVENALLGLTWGDD